MYLNTVQKAVQQAKFGPDQTCAEALICHWSQLRRNTLPSDSFFAQAQAVCFVPAHWRRRIKRGFDFPSLIARAMATMLQIPLLDALLCSRLDMPLSLSSSRQQRIMATQGRYALRLAKHKVAQKCILLVDDVVTTGSTLGAAACVLQQAGATVHQFALARSPKRQQIQTAQI
ncbi:MAG: phosphoribosyltransferase family protein [Myxococcota bacterium]